MRIFVSGATGVVGRRAVSQLIASGHEVTGLSRSKRNDAILEELGASARRGDLFDPASLISVMAGHDVAINLATNIPPVDRAFRRSSWNTNDRIRVEGSKHLVDAAKTVGIRRFIQESITLPYRDAGDRWIDENSRFVPSPTTECVLDAERNVSRFTAVDSVGVALRFGAFYAADADHTRATQKAARMGISMLMGPALAYQSAVHADDAATAVLHALAAPAGIYNVVDDEPLQRGEASAIVAASVGRKRLIKIPDFVMALAGRQTARLLMRSQRVSNARFRSATAWKPRFSSMRNGWPTDAISSESVRKEER